MPGIERWLVPVGVVLLVVALALLLAWLLQRSLIYFPSGGTPGPVAALLPDGEAVTFVTEDGIVLRAGSCRPANNPKQNGLCPLRLRCWCSTATAGIAHYGRRWQRRLPSWWDQLACCCLTAAATAGTPAARRRKGWRGMRGRRWDTWEAGRAWTRTGSSASGSRWAAVAVELARERPPAALILRSPFTSLVDIAGAYYPFLPAGWLLTDRFASIEKIGAVTAPLLVIVGADDRVVPPEQSRRLFAAAKRAERLLEIAGTDHNDYALLASEELVGAVVEFVEVAPGDKGG